MKKPNLFSIATSELSQDAFITWLLQWADPMYKSVDAEINQIGTSFLKALIAKYDSDISANFVINKVEAGRKNGHKDIDIWVKVNDEIFIIIEDKIDTKEHSGQLPRYLLQAQQYKNSSGQPWKIIIPIYLKTGNECINGLLQKDNYKPFLRKDFLCVLPTESQNQILADFRNHLQEIEDSTNEYLSVPYEKCGWYAVQGFYCALQKVFLETKSNREDKGWSSWRYISNRSGGFQGFHWHWNSFLPIGGCLYLQIESYNHFKQIQLIVKGESGTKNESNECMRLESWQIHKAFELLSSAAKSSNFSDCLNINKAGKFKAGEKVSIAKITPKAGDSFIKTDANGLIDMEATTRFLFAAEDFISSVCKKN